MKKRRIINDHDPCGELIAEASTIENKIVAVIEEMAGMQVDTICWNVGSLNGGLRYDTRVAEVDTGGKSKESQNLSILLARGIDPLKTAIKEGHKRKMEVFANLRLNDTHCWSMPELRSKFWKAHYPEHRVRGVKGWGGVEGCLDYSFPEVREKQLEVIFDIATRYDLDGFHLDFMRNPPFFSPRYARQKAPVMTQFIAEAKDMLAGIGRDKGKNIPLSARIRKSILLCEEAGLDIKTWIKKGLLEFIAPGQSNSNDFNIPVAEFKKVIGNRDVGLYPCLCDEAPAPEQYRAYALNCYQEGADGIFLFNITCASKEEREMIREIFSEIGSLKTINKRKRKHYLFSVYAGLPAGGDRDSIQTHIYNEQYNNLPVWSRKNGKIKKTPAAIGIGNYPCLKIGRQNILPPGTWAKVMFTIADSRGALSFKLAGITPRDEMRLKINNVPVEKGGIREEYFWSGHPVLIPPHCRYCLKVTPGLVKKGMNELKIFVLPRAKGSKTDIKMWELEVMVESIAIVGPEPTPAYGLPAVLRTALQAGHPSGGGELNEFRDKSLCSPPGRGTRSGGGLKRSPPWRGTQSGGGLKKDF